MMCKASHELRSASMGALRDPAKVHEGWETTRPNNRSSVAQGRLTTAIPIRGSGCGIVSFATERSVPAWSIVELWLVFATRAQAQGPAPLLRSVHGARCKGVTGATGGFRSGHARPIVAPATVLTQVHPTQ